MRTAVRNAFFLVGRAFVMASTPRTAVRQVGSRTDISARTLEFHHDHHHRAYVDKLNKLIAGTSFDRMPLEEIILASSKSEQKKNVDIFNNAAQAWNHTFLWNCMRAKGGGKPNGGLGRQLDQAFGGLDKFHEQFKARRSASSAALCLARPR